MEGMLTMNLKVLPLGIALVWFAPALASAAPNPDMTRAPDLHGTVESSTAPTGTQAKAGVVAVLHLRGVPEPVAITRETVIQIETGKVVRRGQPRDLAGGQSVSIWRAHGSARVGRASTIIVFLAGAGAFPGQ
jgi:hypothetical protein